MEYVEFPALGLHLPVQPEIFSFELFGAEFHVKWYGLLIVLGLLLAFWYANHRADEFKINKDAMFDVVMVSLVFAILGARLYYVLFCADTAAYFADPISILEIWNGGLAIYGGVLFAFGTALWMCRLRKVDTLRMFDLAAPGFLIGQAIGRWGNFFNQEAFGSNTTLPWGMTGSIIADGHADLSYNHSLPVHPTFLYESLWCLLGLLLLHILSKKAYRFRGELFSLYIMWYGVGRFFIEMLRTDSLYLGTMRVSCLVAALSVIGGAALFLIFRSRGKETPLDLFDEPLPETAEESVLSADPAEESAPNPASEDASEPPAADGAVTPAVLPETTPEEDAVHDTEN